MIVAGEASGDLHGANLVRRLQEREPHLEVFAVAGERLKQEGVKVLFETSKLSGMGLAELAGNLGSLWKAYRLLKRFLREERPALLILIDFPEFNLRLARLAKKLGIPVLYYISPQVWAWRENRIRAIARRVDRMAVVFPFEVPLYENQGVKVTFVGHPLLDVVRPTRPREATLARHGLDSGTPTIALLPGSRRREVACLLPPMLEAADCLAQKMRAQFLLVRASTVERGDLEERVSRARVRLSISDGDTYNVLHACDFVWAASGTATLETALMLRPMIIVYRLVWLTYALARLLVRVDHIGLVNIVAGERIVPELIQSDVTPDRIVAETTAILENAQLRERMVQKLARVRERLGSPGASDRVAKIALEMIK